MNDGPKQTRTDRGSFRFAREASFSETRAGAATADDMKIVQRYALKELQPEEVAVFRMNLCNDQIDRHESRFPVKELRTINRLVVGKPTMVNHDMHSLPRGRFFRSQLTTGATTTHAATKATDVTFVQPDTYMLRTPGNDEFIRHIEAGIYSGTSIGFEFEYPECSICNEDFRGCPHWPGQEYEGERCHYIMHDVVDVFEGSIVPLGSQGTELVEARDMEGIRIPSFKDAVAAAKGSVIKAESDSVPDKSFLVTQRELAESLRARSIAYRSETGELVI